MRLEPLYKWAGGKRKLIQHYNYPYLTRNYDEYVEPFFGGGALFCHLVNNYDTPETTYKINDINKDLIGIYKTIQTDCAKFVEACVSLADVRNSLDLEGRKAWFDEALSQYNDSSDSFERSVLLLLIMRTNFNGIWQQNKGGKLNCSVGKVNFDLKIDTDLIKAWHQVLQRTEITSGDYKLVKPSTNNALVFVDPPYRMENKSGVGYQNIFGDEEQIEVIKYCRNLSIASQKHNVLLTNRNLPDGFFEDALKSTFGFKKDIAVTYTAGRGTKKSSSEFVYSFRQGDVFHTHLNNLPSGFGRLVGLFNPDQSRAIWAHIFHGLLRLHPFYQRAKAPPPFSPEFQIYKANEKKEQEEHLKRVNENIRKLKSK